MGRYASASAVGNVYENLRPYPLPVGRITAVSFSAAESLSSPTPFLESVYDRLYRWEVVILNGRP